MSNISFIDLINEVKKYNNNQDDINLITKAYNFAYVYHSGQKRESGEEYIIHPLNVAYILSIMHADTDTLCAALLHDVLEDTVASKEDIINEFNTEIAMLVDGVTNIKDLSFNKSEEVSYANKRKIITGITKDVRIIIIKLADRLHNMRTLNYKKANKQKEKSIETMEIYIPFAYYIGAYNLKIELEDLSFKYLKPDDYKRVTEQRSVIKRKYEYILLDMEDKLKRILENKEIPNTIRVRIKNVYGIYQKLKEGKQMTDINDLLALKVIVDDIDNCYRTLGIVHSLYKPKNDKFRDYICNPKTNMYQSLHTTVYSGDRFIHTQIKTNEMDKIAQFGLPAFWDMKKGNARNEMQEELSNKFQFFNSLVEMDSIFNDNKEFVDSVKKEVFTDKIYVYTPFGTVVELPKESTIVDYAYKVYKDKATKMIGAIVNDKNVDFNYVLQNKDRVKIIIDELSKGPKCDLESYAKTYYVRKLLHQNKTN